MPGLCCFVGGCGRERNVGDGRREGGKDLLSWTRKMDFWKRKMGVVLVLRGVDEVADFIVWDKFKRVSRHWVKRLSKKVPQILVL